MMWAISCHTEVDIERVSYTFDNDDSMYSAFELTPDGNLIDWTDGKFEAITGVESTGTVDELLDAITDGTVDTLKLK